MSDMIAIIPKGLGHGFNLAGIQIREVSGIEDAHQALTEEIDDENNGIILIDESFDTDMTPKLMKTVDEITVPLVISIPVIKKWEQIHDRDEIINRIIRRAVGYRIKLTED